MIQSVLHAPVRRHPLRRRLGRWWYCRLRYLRWRFGGQRFARQREQEPLPFCMMRHQTPLLRRLKNVDMYLQHNKIVNLRIAAERIDGIVLQPGETFSFWRLTGKPTARRGFLEGLVLENGRVGVGVGGGLCQMGNLIYWMALHTPLRVTERWRHSYDVFPDEARTLPFGSGATLAYNYIDLQIENPTAYAWQIRVFLDETCLHGEIRAAQPVSERYEVFEKEHAIRHEPWGGYTRSNVIARRIWGEGADTPLREEIVAENRALMMYQPFLSPEASGH